MNEPIKPIQSYTEYPSHLESQYKVVGEVYDDPIRQSEVVTIYSRITVFVCKDNDQMEIDSFLFPNKFSEAELQEQVGVFSKNIHNFPAAE